MFTILILPWCLQACTEKPHDKAFLDFDSLVHRQVTRLVRSRASLEKTAVVDGRKDQSVSVPDSLEWATQLDIFKQLDLINKPTFRDSYAVDQVRDTGSNLTVTQIVATQPAPVSFVKMYFFQSPNRLRRIEAAYNESTALYTGTRNLVLEFEEVGNEVVLSSYHVEGSQKMIWDTGIKFVVDGRVSLE